MQEHIRRAHPEHYISKLPATEESFLLMINTPAQDRRQDGTPTTAASSWFTALVSCVSVANNALKVSMIAIHSIGTNRAIPGHRGTETTSHCPVPAPFSELPVQQLPWLI